MTIVYASICRARDATMLVEVCDNDIKGTFAQVIIELMQHLKDHDDIFNDGDMKTFIQSNDIEMDFFSHFIEACNAAVYFNGDNNDESNKQQLEHYFHLYLKDGVYYCCLSDDPDIRDQKVNFAFLQQIQKEFVKRHRAGRIRTANAYALDKNFSPTIRSAMHYHNIHHDDLKMDEKVRILNSQVSHIRDIMGRNLHMILDRGTKFENLLEKSENATADAQIFKKRARKAKCILQQRYYKWYIILAGLIILIIYASLAAMCGFRFEYCRAKIDNMRKNNNSNNNQQNNNENNNNDDENNNDGKIRLF